jgi:integrase
MLSDLAIQNAKPAAKPYKLADSGGLFMLVNPNGSRWWRLRYRIGEKERGISLGVYPDVTLKRARQKRDEARQLLADGIDPSTRRQQEKVASAVTFETVAREWLTAQATSLSPPTLRKAFWMLETFVFKEIGSEAITKVTAPAVLKILRQLEAKHHNETARRTKQRIGQILRYAIATGRAERDVTADLRGALVPFKSRNHAALTEPGRVGELLRAIDGYTGQVTTLCGLQLAALLFLRPGELRAGQWSEFELEGNEPTWRIPAHRMKMRDAHIVPLSKQAVAILNELKGHTGKGDFVFPAIGNKNRPISENTLNTGLRRLGYSNEEMTSHGFRTIASTLLNEKGFHPDLIELQLAHKERNGVRAAYNKAQRLPERRAMMQSWADYLDELRKKGGSETGSKLKASQLQFRP